MARIKLLSPQLYNQIAAGEVIENPVGALKEIVENSIDAGANRITIEVTDGGMGSITVTDNGCGILEDDVQLAFVKHATSKLSSITELYAMQTLGFRGEALASIAAVARVKLTTRHHSMDNAVCVNIEDGKIIDKQYVSANIGTKIEVRNLFYNIPARKQFLKAPSREATNVSKFVAKLILTNPNLKITYYLDGKKIYDAKGDGLDGALYAIYGKDCLSRCLLVNCTRNNMQLYGYVGTPEYSKPNKLTQTLAVNGRYVTDDKISGAITQAFKPYLMTRQFPFYVLHLEIPCDVVDVNIHPKKSEVRFVHTAEVCSIFYHGIQAALENYRRTQIDDILAKERAYEADETIKLSREEKEAIAKRILDNPEIEYMNPSQADDVIAIEQSTREADKIQALKDFAYEMERELSVERARKDIGLDRAVAQSSAVIPDTIPEQISLSVINEPSEEDLLFDRTRILGVAFKTYLILEIDEKIIFVDQHAAHERILFDKFMEGKSNDMQPVLFPYVFKVSDEEADFIEQNRELILKAGIGVEPFGRNTYRISSVSTLLADTKMNDFVNYLLSSVDDFKIDDRTLIVEKIAKKACKAAVKAGYSLNEYEIKYILKEVYNNKILQCPHGRPITVVYSKSQLEKMFKRQV